MLDKLTQAFGPSGYEREVRELIKAEVKDYADDISTDALGNLIVFKRGTGAEKKSIMMAAHMDEIGFQVTKILDSGMIKFRGLGFLWVPTTYMNRVRFRNGITGIVTSTVKQDEIKSDMTNLCIDIGAKSKEDAMKYVKVGDIACYIGAFAELQNGNVTAKAIDNRVGCHMLIETLKRTEAPRNDLYFVFTVQEELGCRGAIVSAERIKPDIGIAVDITPAHDYPCDLEGSNAIGAGVGIKVADPSVICDEYLVNEMVRCCEENNIKYQYDVIYVGGTDAGSINRAVYGIRSAGVTIITRYPHGPNALINMDDVEASIQLLSNYVNRSFKFED